MHFSSWTIAGAIAIAGWITSPVQAQLPGFPNLNLPTPDSLKQKSEDTAVSDCLRLDGRCLFEIARTEDQPLAERIQGIEQRLQDITSTYLKNDTVELEFRQELDPKSNLPNIYVSAVDGRGNLVKEVRLMSVTDKDADLKGVSLEERADQILEQLEQGLEQAQQERQPKVITRRVGIAVGTGMGMIVISLVISYWQSRSKQSKTELESSHSSSVNPISTQLHQKQQWNLTEVQHRLLQLAQAAIWTGGSLFILGLFPYTRTIQLLIISSFKIPLRLGGVGLGTYVAIRLCYALIDRFSSVLATNHLLTPEGDRRSRLRVSTVSGVTKSIVTVGGIGVGVLIALAVVGVDIGPLLAGAGIIGFALSLASQNVIKDALNGFFIILEDQYAVGDVIAVANVSGLVENMNLRITQLRDAEGRLITIPNSEMKIVANLSSTWSRADLSIPVTYQVDVNQALELINQVAREMIADQNWREQILDQPQVLGVDDFGSRGITIRVWIKTQPLKQWDVAREFRRRLKVTFDQAGIPIPLPQQEVWFNNTLPMESLVNGQGDRKG